MTRLRILLFRLSALVRSRQMDREIDDEIQPSGRSDRGSVRQGLFLEEARRPPGAVSVVSRRPRRCIGSPVLHVAGGIAA